MSSAGNWMSSVLKEQQNYQLCNLPNLLTDLVAHAPWNRRHNYSSKSSGPTLEGGTSAWQDRRNHRQTDTRSSVDQSAAFVKRPVARDPQDLGAPTSSRASMPDFRGARSHWLAGMVRQTWS
mmetsp:Transcript_26653/g.88458  ORF Transcript_26653/g.88458 Transcript_26653/m.88458 type:complete len:122 (+) Transcript_26653:2694-3059(+)